MEAGAEPLGRLSFHWGLCSALDAVPSRPCPSRPVPAGLSSSLVPSGLLNAGDLLVYWGSLSCCETLIPNVFCKRMFDVGPDLC